MRQLEAALRQLAERAEPLPTEVLIARIETELGWAGAPSAVAEREEPNMVTRQQPDLEIPTPTPTRQRSRRGPLLAAAAAVVVILAGVGIAFTTGVFDSDTDVAAERLAVATELADTWNQGWESVRDPEVLVSVFADDGVYIHPDGMVTKENMLNFFRREAYYLTNVDRVGELTPIGGDTYTWTSEFDLEGARRRIDWEMELDGDRAIRIEWLRYHETVEPASGS